MATEAQQGTLIETLTLEGSMERNHEPTSNHRRLLLSVLKSCCGRDLPVLRTSCSTAGGVRRERNHGGVTVAGHEEVFAVTRETASFSNCNIVAGPSFTFPVEPTGDDVPMWWWCTARTADGRRDHHVDPPKHMAERAPLMGLITPKRLKENEEFMSGRPTASSTRRCRPGAAIIDQFAQPYTLLVIADLLGVPESDPPELLREAGIGRGLWMSRARTRGCPITRLTSSTATSPSASRNCGPSRVVTC